jgi:hypothetical protein
LHLLFIGIDCQVNAQKSLQLVSFIHIGAFSISASLINFSNDGGGGERVLWCAVKAVQEINRSAKIVIFTGYDPNFTGDQIVARARERFNITIPRPVEFVFLKRRWLVDDK